MESLGRGLEGGAGGPGGACPGQGPREGRGLRHRRAGIEWSSGMGRGHLEAEGRGLRSRWAWWS